jgi:hypothetical protein
MAFQFRNPLRVLFGYMRDDDIRAADARTLARNQAEHPTSTAPVDSADTTNGTSASAATRPVAASD